LLQQRTPTKLPQSQFFLLQHQQSCQNHNFLLVAAQDFNKIVKITILLLAGQDFNKIVTSTILLVAGQDFNKIGRITILLATGQDSKIVTIRSLR
jgi:hypothetical protein